MKGKKKRWRPHANSVQVTQTAEVEGDLSCLTKLPGPGSPRRLVEGSEGSPARVRR
jgi:hypothetical protein